MYFKKNEEAGTEIIEVYFKNTIYCQQCPIICKTVNQLDTSMQEHEGTKELKQFILNKNPSLQNCCRAVRVEFSYIITVLVITCQQRLCCIVLLCRRTIIVSNFRFELILTGKPFQ